MVRLCREEGGEQLQLLFLKKYNNSFEKHVFL